MVSVLSEYKTHERTGSILAYRAFELAERLGLHRPLTVHFGISEHDWFRVENPDTKAAKPLHITIPLSASAIDIINAIESELAKESEYYSHG